MPLIDCDRSHTEPIRAILNDAIAHTTALWDEQPRSAAAMDAWFNAKDVGDYPVIGVTDEAGTLLGFATYGPFRPWSAYRHTVEHTLYVAPGHQRRGLGRALLTELIARARQQHYHPMR